MTTTGVKAMANRQAAIKQADATRLFRAAKNAGFGRARLITYPDGRVEIIGENGLVPTADTPASPFEEWKAKNADTD